MINLLYRWPNLCSQPAESATERTVVIGFNRAEKLKLTRMPPALPPQAVGGSLLYRVANFSAERAIVVEAVRRGVSHAYAGGRGGAGGAGGGGVVGGGRRGRPGARGAGVRVRGSAPPPVRWGDLSSPVPGEIGGRNLSCARKVARR